MPPKIPKVGNFLGNLDKKEGGIGGFGTHGQDF